MHFHIYFTFQGSVYNRYFSCIHVAQKLYIQIISGQMLQSISSKEITMTVEFMSWAQEMFALTSVNKAGDCQVDCVVHTLTIEFARCSPGDISPHICK